ncbi:MAG: 23S rRNA (adenine(2503)-C(2))-methyltransferase RlmN [Planctomycetaceae bacterium]|nr:23S rRNA (adenine(2503)-C(2))-methyltransferase RlmN [Planctomycetaceae bacterium]
MRHLLSGEQVLADWLKRRGYPAYRNRQLATWIFRKRATCFDEMSNLPAVLREELAEQFRLWTSEVVCQQRASDGTEKLLLQWLDGGRIECVLLRDGIRRSICISTQVGCAMGCVFCASGLDGVDRNLTTGEIVEQMLRLQHLLPERERLSHLVVMGMGEPLANLDNLMPALEFANRKSGLGISSRRITISTVGIPRAIRRLAARPSHFHLAVSLHAPDDALRTQLVPVNRNIGLEDLLAAADQYFDVSGRRLTFEYVLLAGVNDRDSHAHGLVGMLKNRPALLNVIPYNPVAGLTFQTPSAAAIKRFRAILETAGLNVHFRRRKGDRIDAACGQLRRSTTPSPPRS